MKLIFASNNENKTKEIRKLLPESFTLLSLKDILFTEGLPETSGTIEGNAIEKAQTLHEKLNIHCFADDTGLEIESLGGAPGVDSAHYSGERNDEKNIQLVLDNLKDKKNRNAQFRTVIALILNKELHLFEGIVKGAIQETPTGTNGFGYDPIFEPENCGKTFAEMSMEEKNRFSHRARAFEKMIRFLKAFNV